MVRPFEKIISAFYRYMTVFDFPAEECSGPVVVGIGVFDGVHLGHRKIISELAEMGRRLSAAPLAVTFFPHPREVLCPASPPRLLLPPDERVRRLRAAGAAGVAVVRFTAETANTPPEAFLDQLLAACTKIRGVCVGSRWKFGRGGGGDAEFLHRSLPKRGVAFKAVAELRMDGNIVSSSAIRNAVASGRLESAAAMLGRASMLFGEVEHGFGEAGPLLHAPTANLRVDFGVLPPDGVYAVLATVGGEKFPALANIGVTPTFKRGGLHRVEVHILGFEGDLYHQPMTLELVSKLRDERTFASAAELERQIRVDRAKAWEILNGSVCS